MLFQQIIDIKLLKSPEILELKFDYSYFNQLSMRADPRHHPVAGHQETLHHVPLEVSFSLDLPFQVAGDVLEEDVERDLGHPTHEHDRHNVEDEDEDEDAEETDHQDEEQDEEVADTDAPEGLQGEEDELFHFPYR